MLRAIVLALLLLPMPALAKVRGWFPHQPGECGWVHGRYAIHNGSGVARIWVIGTHHMLNLRDDADIPPALDFSRRDLINGAIYGDFFVCAIERHRAGEMQQVRIKRVRNLVDALRDLSWKVPSGASDGT